MRAGDKALAWALAALTVLETVRGFLDLWAAGRAYIHVVLFANPRMEMSLDFITAASAIFLALLMISGASLWWATERRTRLFAWIVSLDAVYAITLACIEFWPGGVLPAGDSAGGALRMIAALGSAGFLFQIFTVYPMIALCCLLLMRKRAVHRQQAPSEEVQPSAAARSSKAATLFQMLAVLTWVEVGLGLCWMGISVLTSYSFSTGSQGSPFLGFFPACAMVVNLTFAGLLAWSGMVLYRLKREGLLFLQYILFAELVYAAWFLCVFFYPLDYMQTGFFWFLQNATQAALPSNGVLEAQILTAFPLLAGLLIYFANRPPRRVAGSGAEVAG